jgi:integrase
MAARGPRRSKLRARRDEHQDRRSRHLPEQEVDELDRRGVCPVQVLDDQKERLLRGDREHQRYDGLERLLFWRCGVRFIGGIESGSGRDRNAAQSESVSGTARPYRRDRATRARDHQESRRPDVPLHAGAAGAAGGQRTVTTEARAKTEQIIQHVFHRAGAPIKSFRRAWLSACALPGVPGRIFHDFRRTAVRNLERAGVPRSVAMQMVGHKAEAIYRRYAIVSDADLRAAADKLAAIEPETRTGTTTGTVVRIGERDRPPMRRPSPWN